MCERWDRVRIERDRKQAKMNTSTISPFVDETLQYVYTELIQHYLPDYIKTIEFEYRPWVFSIIGATLIGLSGILPLLIIPVDTGGKKNSKDYTDRKLNDCLVWRSSLKFQVPRSSVSNGISPSRHFSFSPRLFHIGHMTLSQFDRTRAGDWMSKISIINYAIDKKFFGKKTEKKWKVRE